MASYQKVPRRLRWWRTEGRSRKSDEFPEWISGAEKRKRNGAPGRRRISGRGRRFWCCISLCPFCRTDPGLAFYGKIYNSNLPGFRKFLEMLRKIGRSIKTGLTTRVMSGTVTTSYERGVDRMRKMFDQTDAAAAKADAVSSCAASSRSMIAIIMDAIMASIFVAIISIIGTIPYGWRGVQNG